MNAPTDPKLLASIHAVLREHAGLSALPEALTPDTNLFEAGLSSMATVSVMLALEDEFDLEFPESMLGRSTFETIHSISVAIKSLQDA